MRPRASAHVQRKAVALHHTAGRSNNDDTGHTGLGFLPIEGLLRQQGNAAVHIGQHRTPTGLIVPEVEAQVSGLAHSAAGHLRRFIPEGSKLEGPFCHARHASAGGLEARAIRA